MRISAYVMGMPRSRSTGRRGDAGGGAAAQPFFKLDWRGRASWFLAIAGVAALSPSAVRARGEGGEGDGEWVTLRSPAVAAYDLYRKGPKGAVDGDGFPEVPVGLEFDFLATFEFEGGAYHAVDKHLVTGIHDVNVRAEREGPDTMKLPQWKLTGNRLEEFSISPDGKEVARVGVLMVFLEEVGSSEELEDGRKVELVAKGKEVDVPAFRFEGCDEYRVTSRKGKIVTTSNEFWHPDVGLVKSVTYKEDSKGRRKHVSTKELYYYYHGDMAQYGYLSGKKLKPEAEE